MSLKETSTTMLDMVLWRLGMVRRRHYDEIVDVYQRCTVMLAGERRDGDDWDDVNELYDEYAKGE